MNTIVINYDLNRPGQNYSDLYSKIKSLGSAWCHPLESTWFVKTTMTYVQVRDTLKSVIDKNDKLLVTDFKGNAAWHGLSTECSQWLKDNLGTSLLGKV